MKTCLCCGGAKVRETGFSKDRSRRDGFSDRCKDCRKKEKREYYLANRQSVLEKQATRYAEKRDAYLAARKERYAENPEPFLLANRAWRLDNILAVRKSANRRSAECRPVIRQRKAEYYKRNAEFVRSAAKTWRDANREKSLAAANAWRKANPEKRAAAHARRRAAKLFRTPAWLTARDLRTIQDTYLIAQFLTESTGIPHHVDHILPLQGKRVSGLHVPSNLRVVLGVDNLKKSNKWMPE